MKKFKDGFKKRGEGIMKFCNNTFVAVIMFILCKTVEYGEGEG